MTYVTAETLLTLKKKFYTHGRNPNKSTKDFLHIQRLSTNGNVQGVGFIIVQNISIKYVHFKSTSRDLPPIHNYLL